MSIIPLITFNTDIGHARGQKGPFSSNKNLTEIIELALNMNANVICRTTVGTWYIKNKSLKIPYNDILKSLKKNELDNFKPRCRTWVITNNNF